MIKISDLNGNTHLAWPHQLRLTVQGGKAFVVFGAERWQIPVGDMMALAHDLAYAGYDDAVFDDSHECGCAPEDGSLFETRIDKYGPAQIGLVVDSLVKALSSVTDKPAVEILDDIATAIHERTKTELTI